MKRWHAAVSAAALAQYDPGVQMMQTGAGRPNPRPRSGCWWKRQAGILCGWVADGDGVRLPTARGRLVRAAWRGLSRANSPLTAKSPSKASTPTTARTCFHPPLESEAQTIARLEHPYIVPLYDFWARTQERFWSCVAGGHYSSG
ncbi:MAG: hypothetical protein H6668_15665 [Ardenticatenaceae bacterium]|nr:hypothetical protein [Ardenticatenaceae bacterium]